jgi:hypothetical protein
MRDAMVRARSDVGVESKQVGKVAEERRGEERRERRVLHTADKIEEGMGSFPCEDGELHRVLRGRRCGATGPRG